MNRPSPANQRPVIRESGGDRSAVTGGTRVISDRIVIQITAEPGNTFVDRMIALIEGAKRQKTPNEIALGIVLAGLTIVFLLAVATLKFFADYSGAAAGQDLCKIVTVTVLVALLVCLIPTTIGGTPERHRHCGNRPTDPAQCDRQKRPRGRGCRRYRCPPAG